MKIKQSFQSITGTCIITLYLILIINLNYLLFGVFII